MLERGYVTGRGYRIIVDDSGTFDRNISYKIRYPQQYEQWCIAHYESGGSRWKCSLKKGLHYDQYFHGDWPKLRKPVSRAYQRKKDLRYKGRLNQKISEIKNNGIAIVRVGRKSYRIYT